MSKIKGTFETEDSGWVLFSDKQNLAWGAEASDPAIGIERFPTRQSAQTFKRNNVTITSDFVPRRYTETCTLVVEGCS